MSKRLKENLDYTFNYRDLIAVDRQMQKYISDREKMYNELFNSTEDYTVDDLKEYLEYFMSPNASDMDIDSEEAKHHKYLWSIRDFLSRNYEYNLLPSICNEIANVSDCLFYLDGMVDNITDEGMNEIIESEYDCMENLKKFWNDYLVTMANYPLMDLSKLNKTCILGCNVYFEKNTDNFVLNSFLEFLQNVKKDFPQILKKFDMFFILDNHYVDYLADDGDLEANSGTMAFFSDNSIFLKSHCDDLKDESEKFFYKEVLYHEFGHFVWSCLPQYLQMYWVQSYTDWKKKGLKMPRDEERNSQSDVYCQECFADSFACIYLGDSATDEDYIHLPNEQIMDTINFILKKAFEIKEN